TLGTLGNWPATMEGVAKMMRPRNTSVNLCLIGTSLAFFDHTTLRSHCPECTDGPQSAEHLGNSKEISSRSNSPGSGFIRLGNLVSHRPPILKCAEGSSFVPVLFE